jgi:cyclohexyl-isocyanide hydratase
LLQGRRATTHWSSFHLLPYFGAIPEEARVVIDGNLISTAGVSAGIDGSLRLAAMLAGDAAAQRIQLEMEYAPEPPFDSGTPARAPTPILNASREGASRLTAARLDSAQRVANRLRTAGSAAPTISIGPS